MMIKLIASGSKPWERWFKRWGLSYLVDGDVLFDTFASPRVLLKNLKKFGDDIQRIRHVVISHDHWDHTGGLWELLARVPRLTVHLPANANEEFKDRVISMGAKVVEGGPGHKIKEGVYVSGMMTGEHNGKVIAEQALVLEQKGKLIVISGCGHPGIHAMVEQVLSEHQTPVHGIMGGFHFFDEFSKERIRSCVETLKQLGVEMVAPAHCTGAEALKVFEEEYSSNYAPLREGQCLMFGTIDS